MIGILQNPTIPLHPELLAKIPMVPLEGRRLKLIQGHAHGDIRILYHLREFLEAYLAVAIQVGFHNGLVDNLGSHVSATLIYIQTLRPMPPNHSYLL